jgi:hypothetical protein
MMTSENTFNLRENPEIGQKIAVKSSDIRTMIDDLTRDLGAKQKLVLSGRFGMNGSNPLTLEAIGKSLNITRERVRQIEADALDALKKKEKSRDLNELIDAINDIIEEKGGIAKADDLASYAFERYFSRKTKDEKEKFLMEIVFSVMGLKKIKGNKEVEDSWTSRNFDLKKFRSAISQIEKIFDESKKLYSGEDLLRRIDHSNLANIEPKLLPEQVLNFIDVSKKFGKNIFGDWGKARWPLVKPRGVREKATLILLARKKPLHFREISQLIEKSGLSAKKVHPQTVHNELIRDSRFVLVGRGTYALREWGYEEGTVKDIIVKLIKSAGGQMAKDEIISKVLKKRKVKKATIDVNLSDRNVFQKVKGGYGLK